jgi:hypothetical protein
MVGLWKVGKWRGGLHHSREAVGEVDHEERTDQADDAIEIGYGGSDEEGEDPVDGAENVPTSEND